MGSQGKEAWGLSGSYEQYVGRWSRVVARDFLAWLGIQPGRTWSDVGCGTGALIEGILAASRPRAIYAIDRSNGFLAGTRETIKDRRTWFSVGDATALPLANGACDVTVSGLVLNFVPDAASMATEMARVTRRKGQVGVYVWDYSSGMEMMRYFWDAAIQVDPRAAALDEAERFPICQPEPLERLFREAGLSSISVRAIEIPTIFRDFDDYWRPFLGTQGPAPHYLASLDYELRDQIRELLKARLVSAPDGSIHLKARAWGLHGFV